MFVLFRMPGFVWFRGSVFRVRDNLGLFLKVAVAQLKVDDPRTYTKQHESSGTRVETVNEYFAAVPEDARAALRKLRETIKAAAPMTREVISYQIPAHKHQNPNQRRD
jgi:hypothetical protein